MQGMNCLMKIERDEIPDDFCATLEKAKGSSEEPNVCSICLEKIREADKVVLMCKHEYHDECI